MQITSLDWWIVGASIVVSFVPALLFMKRAGSATDEFFTSGRAAGRHLDGGHHVQHRHAQPRHQPGARERGRQQLDGVGVSPHRDGHRLLLRAALAPLERAHGSRGLRVAVLGPARVTRAWVPRRLPGAVLQRRDHGGREPRRRLNFAHYALRPWPWVLVALCSLLVFPTLDDIRPAFPYVDPALIDHDMACPAMLKFLPTGFIGLMIAGMLAAYVSTLATHLNWGTSYLVHDFYRRFVRTDATEAHYVLVGRVVTGLLMVVAAGVTFVLDSARQSFELLLSIGAGTGLIYLLRWFWWRINAWSEIAAMAGSFAIALGFFIARKAGAEVPAHLSLLITVAATTVIWVVVTFITQPTDLETLVGFYQRVRPAGPGWQPVEARAAAGRSPDSLAESLLGWTLGCAAVYAALFGTGTLLYGRTAQAVFWVVVFAASTIGLWRLLPRLWSGSETA